jgi:orotate phosphoribosyltransferase
LYGPAYKGIFLGTIVAMIYSHEGTPIPLSFNRKEIKDHGEGGNIIGSNPTGEVMIIDDVLSAGTAARESINLIKIYDALPKFFLVGLDRQEKGNGDFSAKHDLAKNFGINVLSIINLDDLIYFSLNNENFSSYAEELERYRTEWGA